MKTTVYLLLVGLFTFGCTTQNDPLHPGEDAKPIILKASQQQRVAQDNEFALDLLKKTIADSKETNVFVSPLSVSIALGMAWNGANGETKTQMETALKMSGLSVEDINDYYKVMQTTLPTIDPTTKLSIANSLWYRTGFPVKTDFLKVNSDYFNTEVRELDFNQAWAVDTINNWCSRKTNKLIPTIIDDISSDAMLYLINAVYFKGIWRNKFDKKQTAESNFTNDANKSVLVNMMYQKDTFKYTSDADAQYLDMPYGNKAFSMTVILPTETKTTADILNSLTVEKWNSTLTNMTEQQVFVRLPRFKVENKFVLNDVLKTMGMPLAFSADDADFSKISTIKLFISAVIHKTYVTVDEEGTEAAAVTAIELINTSVPNYPVFTVNKPFVFVIREQSTGVILFIGKIGNVEKY
ncbi:MAG: serpin family protein [Paludibacter sp.]|nr:serpin family protein [Paludibacter sp.]